jgi:hydrogenase expression/formation protein HypD
VFKFRDKELANQTLRRLKSLDVNAQFMHVCGTHQDTLVRFGLEEMIHDCGVRIRQGPGCPVCVTTQKEFMEAELLAKKGFTLAAFGDVSRVPVRNGSLLDLRTEKCDVRVVYSITDAVKIAREKPEKEVIFMAVGFETTAPSTAVTLLNEPPVNFSILSCHRYVPPILKALLNTSELNLDGLIEPGHVSTVIGVRPYEELSIDYEVPQVIAGFEPLDMLIAVYMLALQVSHGEAKVENEYRRTVNYEGNKKALKIMKRVFEPCDTDWRGFSQVSKSGMKVKKKFQDHDARRKFKEILENVEVPTDKKMCRCGDLLRGLAEPTDCKLFGTACTPSNPIGPCMVSIEGSCNIEYKFGRNKNLRNFIRK